MSSSTEARSTRSNVLERQPLLPLVRLAGNTVVISIEMRRITWLPSSDWGDSRSSCRVAVSIEHRSDRGRLGRHSGDWLLTRAMTVIVVSFVVRVTTLGIEAARMTPGEPGSHRCKQQRCGCQNATGHHRQGAVMFELDGAHTAAMRVTLSFARPLGRLVIAAVTAFRPRMVSLALFPPADSAPHHRCRARAEAGIEDAADGAAAQVAGLMVNVTRGRPNGAQGALYRCIYRSRPRQHAVRPERATTGRPRLRPS
jgi:hypothetical protein